MSIDWPLEKEQTVCTCFEGDRNGYYDTLAWSQNPASRAE